MATAPGQEPVPWYVRWTRWRQTSRQEAQAAEQALLSQCSRTYQVADVRVGPTDRHYMHMIHGGPEGGTPVVMLPGYGAGAGFFWRNLDAMAEHFRVFSVDLLGNGMSGRPHFHARSREQAEDFFLSALDVWREKMGFDQMVLVGHSLGGYLAATYALQHPEHVKHLLLICPAGIREKPEHFQPPAFLNNPWSPRSWLFQSFQVLFQMGATPGGFLRFLGPMGHRFVQGYAENRFQEQVMTEQERSAFVDYFHHIMAARGSGEHALRLLLGKYAFAHRPLHKPLHQLKVPMTFIYGENDWLDPRAGQEACASIGKLRGKLNPVDLTVDLVPGAGHYPYLESPAVFIRQFREQLREFMYRTDPQ